MTKRPWPRVNCAHCGRDVARNPYTGQVSLHLLPGSFCPHGCCGSPHGSEDCAGSEQVDGVAR